MTGLIIFLISFFGSMLMFSFISWLSSVGPSYNYSPYKLPKGFKNKIIVLSKRSLYFTTILICYDAIVSHYPMFPNFLISVISDVLQIVYFTALFIAINFTLKALNKLK